MSSPRRPPGAADHTDVLVEQLRTADAAALIRIADAALSWLAIVDLHFRQRYPLEYAAWRATVTADGLAASADEPPPTWKRH